MDQNEFRKAKESGELVTDAALQEAKTELIDDQFQEEESEAEEVTEELGQEETEETETEVEEETEELTPKEKTAFDKRMERETKKLEEKLRKEIEEQSEQKYSKHREAIEALGGDPDKLLSAARDAKLLQDANALAAQNGWNEADTQWYIEDQKNKMELKELRAQMQINKLKDQPDYLGIDKMEREIIAKIDMSKGALTVEEAFWALGGPKRVEQAKLEAQQREIARRAQPTRTVVKDTPSTQVGEKPLSATVLAEAKKMGISEAEARKLMNAPAFNNIDEWREQRKQAK
jgi:hypothetical protein